jgi:hypothetical protein
MWSGIKKNEDLQVSKEHISHKNRLNLIKSRVDTQAPKELLHVKQKLKSKALKQSHISTIHAENQILLQKMMEINTRGSNSKKLHENSSSRSLNEFARAQQLSKITEENLNILNRLQEVKSSYNFRKWNKEFKFKKYLSQKLSENSRRIPRVSSIGGCTSFDSTKSPLSRPDTAHARNARPGSSNGVRGKVSYLEL